MRLLRPSLAPVLLISLFLGCEPKPEKRPRPTTADLVKAPEGLVKDVVYDAMRAAEKDGRRLVVYVGASWCEPCEVFLGALRDGKLPPSLSDLRVLKFDNDVDDERLEKAEYGGQMIPRFVKPRANGTGSAKRFEGSVKGPQAIDDIVPKLEALFED